jgi:CBS domain containing-hemolysin-like protein
MSWILVILVLMVAATLRLGASSLIGTAQADAMRASFNGVKGAARAADLVERRDVMVQAVAVVHSTLLVVATLCAVWAVDRAEGGVLRLAALAGVAATVVAVGDVIPRVIGRARPGRIGYALSPLVETAIRLGSLVTEATVSAEDESPATEADAESETQERELISSVLEFSETLVLAGRRHRARVLPVPGHRPQHRRHRRDRDLQGSGEAVRRRGRSRQGG